MTSRLLNNVLKRTRAAIFMAVVLAIGSVVFASPSSAVAAPGAQRCVDVAEFDVVGLHGFFEDSSSARLELDAELGAQESENASVENTATPCELDLGDDEDADPSSNLCFEAAGEPISTLPRFIAQWRGEQEAAQAVDSILRALQSAESEQTRKPDGARPVGSALVAISLEMAPARNIPADDSLMCTTHPEQCHALPPLPTMTEIVAVAGVSIPRHLFETPPVALPQENRPWAVLRVGPQSGHQRVPEQPPRA